MLNNGDIISDTNWELEVTTDGFNLSITEGGEGVQFRSEDYGMEFKFQL